MKKNTILIAIIMLLCNSLFATTYTFTGTGNWNDVARWSPSLPIITVESDTILINGHCSINASDSIYFSDPVMPNFLYIIINDSLINNGSLITTGLFIVNSNAVFINHGDFEPNGNYNYGGFVNYGLLINDNNINSSNSSLHYFNNYGTIENRAYIFGLHFTNYGIINSHLASKIESTTMDPPMDGLGFVTNSGTINGSTTIINLYNSSNAILSPGFGLSETETINVFSSINSKGIIKFDIYNSVNKDLIILNNIIQNVDSLGSIIVEINSSFTPVLTDTFVLFQSINSSSYSLQNTKFNISLPQPPTNYIWKVIKEQDRIYITLDFALPEPITFFKFKAEKSNNTSLLKYKIYEKDNDLDQFVVERSSKDFKFIKIGEFKYDENNLEYSFIDTNPMEGENIYHIIAYNKDGKINQPFVTNACELNFYEINGIVINTIVENDLLISLENSTEIKIINQVGGIVFKQTIEKGHSKISLSYLSKGIYFVQTPNTIYKILKL